MKNGRRKNNMVIYFCGALALIIISYIILKLIVFIPPIKGDYAIASLEKVDINGIDQTIYIRSNDINNPILLYLHSGPGTTEMVSFRTYCSKLKENFTVVIWEQRGTGKSYNKNIKSETMTLDNMVSDAGEVIKYLLDRFNQKKLFLVGHSWGSLLGILTAQKYPEYIFAYVGSGQEVEPAAGEKISYSYTLEKAVESGSTKAINELKQINDTFKYLTVKENTDWYKDIIIERKWLVKFGGEAYNSNNYSFMVVPGLLPSEYTLIDFIHFGQGSEFSLKALWPQIMEVNLNESATKLSIPIFFFQGKHDYNTPSTLVEDYYNVLDAPYKELIWFESSGHHPMYEESELYQTLLIEKLLPIANNK